MDESSYHHHGPVFTDHCNRIGALLGLPEVVVRNRGGKKLPKSAQWPHCVRPNPGDVRHQKTVTARTVSIPVGYYVSVIDSQMIDDKAFLHIRFDPASGDGQTIEIRLEVDTAYQLADFILDDTMDSDTA